MKQRLNSEMQSILFSNVHVDELGDNGIIKLVITALQII